MEHLDAATLEEFQAFNKKFYSPNNAVLVVAGHLDIPQTKAWIEKIFRPNFVVKIERKTFVEEPITETIKATYEDPNIQKPMVVACIQNSFNENTRC
jgi:predicted Zn-dependent peptidase